MKIEVTASEYAKSKGLKNLKSITEMIGVKVGTLNNWKKNKPELFHAVVTYCANPDALEHLEIMRIKLGQVGIYL